jgi:hypothetical protein
MIGADGKPILHRDMAKYYRLNAPAFVSLGCSVALVLWSVTLASKRTYERVSERKRRANQHVEPIAGG